jgi:hypothetical protein
MSRVFINRSVAKWMRRTRISERQLCDTVAEMQSGLIDADLGGGIVKKRIAIKDRGKSTGERTLFPPIAVTDGCFCMRLKSLNG